MNFPPLKCSRKNTNTHTHTSMNVNVCIETGRSVQITAVISLYFTTSRAVKWNPPTLSLRICFICEHSLPDRGNTIKPRTVTLIMSCASIKSFSTMRESINWNQSRISESNSTPCSNISGLTFPRLQSFSNLETFSPKHKLPCKLIFRFNKVPSGATEDIVRQFPRAEQSCPWQEN